MDKRRLSYYYGVLYYHFKAASGHAGVAGVTFHDLRHTWKRNARCPGLDPYVVRQIQGHAGAKQSIDDGCDILLASDAVKAIDRMTFDHGDTYVWTRDLKDGTKVVQDDVESFVTKQY